MALGNAIDEVFQSQDQTIDCCYWLPYKSDPLVNIDKLYSCLSYTLRSAWLTICLSLQMKNCVKLYRLMKMFDV